MSEVSNSCLNETDGAVVAITYHLTEVKSAHYESIVKKMSVYSQMKPKERFKHFMSMSKYFKIDGTGYVKLSTSFSLIRKALKNFSISCLETQDKLKKIIKVKLREVTTENPKENKDISPKPNKLSSPDIPINLTDIIVDISVLKLSIREKMKIDNLNKLLHCSGVKPVQNYFSYQTVTVIKNFFVDMPEYFEVTRDDFISLKKGLLASYEPKTNLIVRDSKGGFVLNKSSDLIDYGGPDFVMSGSSSKVSNTLNSLSSQKPGQKNKLSNQKQPTNSEKCLSFSTKKLQKSPKVASTAKSMKTKKHQVISNVAQNIIQLSHDFVSNSEQNATNPPSVEQFKQKSNISPSTTESSKSSRTASVTSIPERITVTFHSECKQNQFWADSDNGQSCDISSSKDVFIGKSLPTPERHGQSCHSSSTKYLPLEESLSDSSHSKVFVSSLRKPACNPTKFQIPRQPCKKSNSPSNLLCNATKNKVPATADLAAIRDSSKTCASSLPELESRVSQIIFKDLDSFVSYGEELVCEFLDDTCSFINGRSDDRNLASASSPDISDDASSIHLPSPDKPGAHRPQCGDVQTNPGMISKTGVHKTELVSAGGSINAIKHQDLFLKESSPCGSSGTSVEFKAVNFFAAILGNYSSGASANFLVRHLNRASPEVETFMREHYRKDLLSFFAKHREVFYVLPDSDQIYLMGGK